MKLRRPKGPAPSHDISNDGSNLTKTLRIETITPIYGGGVEAGTPDIAMPVRASAVRGQLRFWWRILHNTPGSNNNPETIFQTERSIFGGIDGKNGAKASRVSIWISDISGVDEQECAEYKQRDNGDWIATPRFHIGPGYAMFPGQGRANKYEVTERPKKVLMPGLAFNLNITIYGQNATSMWTNELLPTLRWWASFGGLGARTRRGMGAIKTDDLDPVTAADALSHGCRLVSRPGKSNAKTAWIDAVDRLKDFRQGERIGRNPGPGRSRWPEADSIREITGRHAKKHVPSHPSRRSFPRAAFGLPIVTHFKDSTAGDPEDTTLYPLVNGNKEDRLASPIILKPMWNISTYSPIALLLPYQHVADMGLQLENNTSANNDNLPCEIHSNDCWPPSAREKMINGEIENPLKNRSGDVLTDFLDFFGGQA